jgi:hypothetical protein
MSRSGTTKNDTRRETFHNEVMFVFIRGVFRADIMRRHGYRVSG